ncbi:MAG: divalent metal cation transporter [Gemmatimonadales bacterium]|nr:divalent metal cation transporter [Gemmatimonadales bacterium]
MKRFLEIGLGIVTGIGGFLEAGSLATAAQAGADFRFSLGWSIALGTICLAFLVEMSGRLAAVSRHTIPDVMRERFGFTFFVAPLVVMQMVMLLVLATELGGVCLALQLASGVAFRWWALPVMAVTWLLLWKGTFGIIEKGVSMLGLVTLAFAVAAWRMHPPVHDVLVGLVPSLPTHDAPHYWFIAVSVLGASISPYLFFFYSSGAVEDKWDAGYLGINRITAGLGMGFGGLVALAALITAAMVFHPAGVKIESYEQLPILLTSVLGRWGFVLFVLTLAIACFGAALELALTMAYTMAQGFGWQWSEDLPPAKDARFSVTYTIALVLAAVPVALGTDILKLTNFSMALTAASLPLVAVPLLIIMNDPRYLGDRCNGWISNTVALFVIALAFVLAIVAIPLELIGG